MSEGPFRKRRVSPVEVQRILKRAAELSLVEPSTAMHGRAFTTDELEEHLRELGISDEIARLAMQRAPGPVAPAEDGAVRVERKMELDGAVSPEHFEILAELISSKMPLVGRASVVGNKLTWLPAGVLNEPAVTVHAKNGVTTIRYVETLINKGQMSVGFGVLSGMGALMTGTTTLLSGAALAQAADISKASGGPVVLGASVLVGIVSAIAFFVGLRRSVAKRAARKSAFAEELIAELAVAIRAANETSPVKTRVKTTAESGDVAERLEEEAAIEEERARSRA